MVTSPGFALQTHTQNLIKYMKQPSSHIRQSAVQRYSSWRKGTKEKSLTVVLGLRMKAILAEKQRWKQK